MKLETAQLLEDLANAAEGDRELSNRVLLEFDWSSHLDHVRRGEMWEGGYAWKRPSGSPVLFEDLPDPTRSLEDAMALAKDATEIIFALKDAMREAVMAQDQEFVQRLRLDFCAALIRNTWEDRK